MTIIADADRTRAGYIAGLRQLADLLEAHPAIPYNEYIGFALRGTGLAAADTIERTAAALTAAGIDFTRRDDEHSQSLKFVVAGVDYHFSRVHDAAWAEHLAQMSYEDNVRAGMSC